MTDNEDAPFLVVEGPPKRVASGYYAAYAAWLGRGSVWAEDFAPSDDWNGIRGGGWQLEPWGRWVREHPGRRLVLSVPLLPGNWKGDGPVRGIDAGKPVSLAEGATGAYNEHFKTLAERLVANGLGRSVIRLGWEFNGGWYAWRARGREDAFIGYWRQVVATMRAVPGSEELRFCWNPTIGLVGSEAWKCWPGEEWVDVVGLDVYDQSWMPDTYPIPHDAGIEEALRRRRRHWDETLNSVKRDGLPFWGDFAKNHGGKPIAICEWGLVEGEHGGGDNVFLIERMHEFITDPENNVYFTCYFDVNAPDGGHVLFTCDAEPGRVTKFPRAAARFRELFSASPR